MADDSSEIVKEQSEAGAAGHLAVVGSVTAANTKSLGDGPAFYHSLAMGNAVAHQNRVNAITEAAMGKVIEAIIGVSPSEGGADVAALQQLMKGAQTTPPVTG